MSDFTRIEFVIRHAEEKAVETSRTLKTASCPKEITRDLKKVWDERYKNCLFSLIREKIIKEAESKGFLDTNSKSAVNNTSIPTRYQFICFTERQLTELENSWNRSYEQGKEEYMTLENTEIYS
jgi:hypothetical protein